MYPTLPLATSTAQWTRRKAKLVPPSGRPRRRFNRPQEPPRQRSAGAQAGQDALGNPRRWCRQACSATCSMRRRRRRRQQTFQRPVNTGWSTVWQASPTPRQPPQRPPVAPPHVPTMPTGGPATSAPSGLPCGSLHANNAHWVWRIFGAGSRPPRLFCLMSMPPQIGTPPGTQPRMTVNRAPAVHPAADGHTATGKRPVGTVTAWHVVQANGLINTATGQRPAPVNRSGWWQANSMGYTVQWQARRPLRRAWPYGLGDTPQSAGSLLSWHEHAAANAGWTSCPASSRTAMP